LSVKEGEGLNKTKLTNQVLQILHYSGKRWRHLSRSIQTREASFSFL